jgi:hypothetical protein
MPTSAEMKTAAVQVARLPKARRQKIDQNTREPQRRHLALPPSLGMADVQHPTHHTHPRNEDPQNCDPPQSSETTQGEIACVMHPQSDAHRREYARGKREPPWTPSNPPTRCTGELKEPDCHERCDHRRSDSHESTTLTVSPVNALRLIGRDARKAGGRAVAAASYATMTTHDFPGVEGAPGAGVDAEPDW